MQSVFDFDMHISNFVKIKIPILSSPSSYSVGSHLLMLKGVKTCKNHICGRGGYDSWGDGARKGTVHSSTEGHVRGNR